MDENKYFNMKTTAQRLNKKVLVACLALIILCGCGQHEMEGLFIPGGDGASDASSASNGKPVAFSINLQGAPEYNSPGSSDPSTRTSRSTRSCEPLISEWVKVSSFNATRSVDDNDVPGSIAAMELFEDAVATTPQTRGVMPTGYYFRLIAFKKSGSGYVFQSVADYTSNGGSAPVLKQGRMNLPIGQTYRFVAYSFNNTTSMGALPSTYTWNSTSISIPNLSNDFMTFVSGDIKASGTSLSLPVSFTHQLCKLTIKITASGFDSNTFSNCAGVYVKEGGSSSSWTVGASGIAANTSNSATFSIPNNNTSTSTRLVPFSGARAITVHFGTLTVGGKDASNLDITSSQSVKLLAGKSYTMSVQFKKGGPGIQVPPGDIDLGGTNCTEQDKSDLSKLSWAPGNLKSTGSSNYVCTTATDYGYYYTWYSTYTGNTSRNNTDPCSKLTPGTYGSGWITPTKVQLEALSHCTDKSSVSNNGTNGIWFMSKTKGLFLPAAGHRGSNVGSGTTATGNAGTYGNYWSSDSYDSNNGHILFFYSGNAYLGNLNNKSFGFSVRCVK